MIGQVGYDSELTDEQYDAAIRKLMEDARSDSNFLRDLAETYIQGWDDEDVLDLIEGE